jgi:hypothetical protein
MALMESYESSQPAAEKGQMLWDAAMRATQKVQGRLDDDLGKFPLIEFLTRHLGSLLYGASQKLIDKQRRTGQSSPQDEAVIMSIVRLFNDSFAGYQLVRQGLILQAIVLLRSAFEVSTQGLLFMEHPLQAERWLKGYRIKPQAVRDLVGLPETERKLYQKLSRLAHPNYDALPYLSVPVPFSGGIGIAWSYGGWHAPKEAAQVAVQFLWAELLLLQRFYARYSPELQQHGLLWAQQTKGALRGEPDFSWEKFLSIWYKALTDLTNELATTMPSDAVDVGLDFSDFNEEQKEAWRQQFEELRRSSLSQGDDSENRPPAPASPA